MSICIHTKECDQEETQQRELASKRALAGPKGEGKKETTRPASLWAGACTRRVGSERQKLYTYSGLGMRIGILCPGKMYQFFIKPLTKDKSIIIGNRYQIDFSPDLPTSRFPGNFRLFLGHKMPILLPSPHDR
jgi:hypothetical protein